ncbi:hypothetical protein HMPREF9441_03055 [Paraprevotella clara YIT 11840]|uniref:Uncharacterized protein n=1 Tax=Paraprevotella clara YIT 11840 TaxID=762968 RepID=G5SUJ5_9BACT|nr:hypothetical protein HMPREF9441_03055 [Paraprevotella clara YIT 11840]
MSACYILLDKSMQTDYLTSYIYKECAGIGVENSLPLRYPAHPLVSIIATKFS